LRELVKDYKRQGMTGVKIARGEIIKEDGTERVVLYSPEK